MPYLIKTSAMTSGKARALEALAGLAVGGGAGGYLAAKTHQTKKPRYWLQDGRIYGRDLTQQEKKDFGGRLAKAALGVGTAVAGLSLGGSAIRRGMLNKADIIAGRAAFARVFEHLGGANRKASQTYASRKGRVSASEEALAAIRGQTGGRASATSTKHNILDSILERDRRALNEARSELRQIRSVDGRHTSRTYIDMAKRTRDARLWGGRKDRIIPLGDSEIKIPGQTTAEGQMERVLGNLGLTPTTELTPDGIARTKAPGVASWERLARTGSF
jgi:hypothetical protein